MNTEIKEKSYWYYIGRNIKNSFDFFISKIDNKLDEAVIVTNKDTPEMNIFKVKISHLERQLQMKRLKKIKE